MVCDRCKWVVKTELEKLGHQVMVVNLGEVELKDDISDEQRDIVEGKLQEFGFELMNDKSSVLIEQIKTQIIQLVQNPEKLEKQNLSDYLSKTLHKDYSSLSKLFSEVAGVTIEQFFILQKIERRGWEFQMLHGVRREAQRALVRDGFGMRVYVPFGADWYPYFSRRIAERPANLLFVLRQLAR